MLILCFIHFSLTYQNGVALISYLSAHVLQTLASTSIASSGTKTSLKASSIGARITPLYWIASAPAQSKINSSWTVAIKRTSEGNIATVLTMAIFKTSAAEPETR